MSTINDPFGKITSDPFGKITSFESFEELLEIDFIKKWTSIPGFFRFSLRSDGYLIAEFSDENFYFLVGMITGKVEGLPIFNVYRKLILMHKFSKDTRGKIAIHSNLRRAAEAFLGFKSCYYSAKIDRITFLEGENALTIFLWCRDDFFASFEVILNEYKVWQYNIIDLNRRILSGLDFDIVFKDFISMIKPDIIIQEKNEVKIE